MTATSPAGIILAAGKGTRMKSELPKGLHRVAGVPMVALVARALRAAGVERIVIVIGHEGEKVKADLGDSFEYAWQDVQLGTGHATLMARAALVDHVGPVIVAPADAPLLDDFVFTNLLEAHRGAGCTVATAILDNPAGYGRLIRDEAGNPIRIVEERDARPEQKLIREVAVSLYCFDCQLLLKTLPALKNNNSQGEYYLTDVVEAIHKTRSKIVALPFADTSVLMGVNDRWQLAQAETAMRTRILRKHALAGVTLLDPSSTYIGLDVEVGVDTVIEPATYLVGRTSVGARCKVGPNTRIEDSSIGDDTRVLMSHVVRARIGNRVKCGPFANIRPGSDLRDGVKIGNFVEVKNATLGEGVSASHLSYIGDAEIGADSNVGAGVITCNFDGFEKHRTVVGKEAFVGSNSTLVAPIVVGDGAFIAAGSTVTKDVPEDAAAFGRARQETKEGWAKKWREKRQSQ